MPAEQEVHLALRGWLSSNVSPAVAESTRSEKTLFIKYKKLSFTLGSCMVVL